MAPDCLAERLDAMVSGAAEIDAAVSELAGAVRRFQELAEAARPAQRAVLRPGHWGMQIPARVAAEPLLRRLLDAGAVDLEALRAVGRGDLQPAGDTAVQDAVTAKARAFEGRA
ncbi:hypothetical protein [Siccirubricoccus phaeus]|uniref:hypothetical protein n=1 Tax=Siccirubricoccus phaeus TaxID=2595053 RepID=UPI0011F3B451|nr:hypothetical protein [Siccirubricoccus phaeus]